MDVRSTDPNELPRPDRRPVDVDRTVERDIAPGRRDPATDHRWASTEAREAAVAEVRQLVGAAATPDARHDAARAEAVAEARELVRSALTVTDADIAARTTANRINLADDVPSVHVQAEYGGYLDVVMHGDASGTQAAVDGERSDFNLQQTALMIENSTAWERRPVRLMSCDTGAGAFAQDLADRIGVPVFAPDGVLEARGDGTKRVLDSDEGAPGRWKRFEPTV